MNRITVLFKTFVECYEVGCTNHPKNVFFRFICKMIDKTINRAAKKDGLKTNESTIKTATPRGALLLSYDYV